MPSPDASLLKPVPGEFARLALVGDWWPTAPIDTGSLFQPGTAVVANLETALRLPDAALDTSKAYAVTVNEAALKHATDSGVTAVSLANNHVWDAGPRAFQTMRDRLNAAGKAVFGLESQPGVVLNVAGKRVGILAGMEAYRARPFTVSRLETLLDIIPAMRDQVDLLFITPHWGKESEFAGHPSPAQRKLADAWIKAGADGVFGHHPHTIQAREVLADRPVFYSLGNFFFLHEESRLYPLTQWGFAAVWEPRENASINECVTPTVLRPHLNQATEPGLTIAPDAERDAVLQWCDSLREDLGDDPDEWTWERWAQHVGPVYWEKNMRSWRLRLRRAFLKTLPRLLVWRFLPKTRLLRRGAKQPAHDFLQRREDVRRELQEAVQQTRLDVEAAQTRRFGG